MNLNFDFDGLTRLKDWWKIVRDNMSKIQEACNKEVIDRQNGDNALNGKMDALISNEAAARINADTLLKNKLDSEETSRKSADTVLQGNIDTEKQARQEADNNLMENMADEISERKRVDDKLQNQIVNMSAQNNIYSLYGSDIITHNAVLDIVWTDTDFAESFMVQSEAESKSLDIGYLFDDHYLDINEMGVFNSALSDPRWDSSFSLSITENVETEKIVMCMDIERRRSWLERDVEHPDENRYENGIWKFEIGEISIGLYSADDGSGTYELSASGKFYHSQGHSRFYASYDGLRNIAQLEGGYNFLDAINTNMLNISKIPLIKVDSDLSATSNNPVKNKTIYAKFEEFNTSLDAMRSVIGTLTSELDSINGEEQV